MSAKSELLRKRQEEQRLRSQSVEHHGDDMIDEIARKDGITIPEPKEEEQTEAPESEPVASEPKAENIDNKADLEKTAGERAEEVPLDEPKNNVITMHKEIIPEDKKNLAVSRTFSIDRETLEELAAVVSIMQASDARIDNRQVTESSFIRMAIKDEIARLERKNGKEFRNAINDLIKKEPEKKQFAF